MVDANVFVAATTSTRGASRETLRRCLRGRYEPLMSQALFAEYESVLARPGSFHRSPVSGEERHALWGAIASRCVWVRVYYLWRPNLRHEADNQVVELAVAGNAEAIVTHDTREFRRNESRFPGLTVVTPGALVAES